MEIEEETLTQEPKQSVLIKLLIIAALILLLLIPSSWIQDLITEREGAESVMKQNVSASWSGSQLIQGPVLVIPYRKSIAKTPSSTASSNTGMLYVLPENLNIKAQVGTEIFHRGIIDATVYHSKLLFTGNFIPSLVQANIKPEDLLTDKAQVVFSLSDLKGLKSNPVIQISDQKISMEPIYAQTGPFGKGLQAPFHAPANGNIPFSFSVDLNGSNELGFLHLGKTTDVQLTSDWKSPSFSGHYLPDKRNITANGFDAHWRMLYFNRPFPQQWVNNNTLFTNQRNVNDAMLSVKFHLPVDQYRKTLRTTKYSTLIILLTFVSLFLTELIRKQQIHIFNYILIGAAMVVYYTLLLSFAEHVGYDWAYLISSVSTIGLIAWFTASILGNSSIAVMFGSILSMFYGFIYVIIQLEELSLLIGSIALFLIVAALMYFSRKINWDKH